MNASIASARVLAAQTVQQVLGREVTLDAALESAVAAIEPMRAAAVRSLSYGAVRGHFRYQAILGRLLAQPLGSVGTLPQAIFGIALFEIEDARTPQYAIVDAAVESARSIGAGKLSGLINAVLRRYLRERAEIDRRIDKDAASRYAFPEWMARQIKADWESRSGEIMLQCDRQAPLWLRINSRRVSDAAYLEELNSAGITARLSDHVPHAIVLDAPCDVRNLPGFSTGLVSVQDLGAQCVAFPLALAAGQRVLDACAAPGGKTGLIAEREAGLEELVAADIDPRRIKRIAENLARSELHARLVQADAAAPASPEETGRFDRILLDVPCSGLGVIRRHPDIRLRRQSGDIERFAHTQSALLEASWTRLAPGGRLVYASCTITRRENHEVLARFAAQTLNAKVLTPDRWEGWPRLGVLDGLGVQILPGEAGADGFYYAVLTKQ